MDYLVPSEVRLKVESFPALFTFIGLLTSVRRPVLCQLGLTGEGLPTVFTLVGPLTRVGFLMLSEV